MLFPAIQALFITAALFIIWDHWVIGYFWNFNPAYILGVMIGNIPIEEIFFFFTVPYACLFLWNNTKPYLSTKRYAVLPWLLLVILIFTALQTTNLPYTFSVIIGAIILILGDQIFTIRLFARSGFLIFLSCSNILTFIFNYYLTSRPIVLYNQSVKSNNDILTIPLEDFIYGMILIATIILLYEYFVKSYTSAHSPIQGRDK